MNAIDPQQITRTILITFRSKLSLMIHSSSGSISTNKILHAEDNLTVAKQLGEMFEREEWRVDLCTEGGSAL